MEWLNTQKDMSRIFNRYRHLSTGFYYQSNKLTYLSRCRCMSVDHGWCWWSSFRAYWTKLAVRGDEELSVERR